MKVKTSELQGAALDWAVAKCEGYFIAWFVGQDQHYWESAEGAKHFLDMRNATGHGVHWTHRSTDWGEGGPIIEREKINVKSNLTRMPKFPDYDWFADCPEKGCCVPISGATPLIAAMRCYVASELGYEVEIPVGIFKETVI